MKTWIRTRNPNGTRCGRCGARLSAGAPMLVLAGGTPSAWWTVLRCAACAGESAPVDVTALPADVPLPPGASPRVTEQQRPTILDEKQRQLGGDQ